MKTLHVNVDQTEIDNGEHHRCCSCPIANALFEAGKVEDVSVHIDDGYLTLIKETEQEIQSILSDNPPILRKVKERGIYRFKLPKIAQDFIKKWDAKEEVKPIAFDIDLKYLGKGTGRCTLPTMFDLEAA